jgi:hypothetical protein
LHISNADLKLLNKLVSSKSHDFSALPALRHLTVGFEENGGAQGQGDMSILEGLIATPSVESLGISFVPYLGDSPVAVTRLSDIINEKQHWPYLTILSLKGFITTETALRQLLERHSATLQSLELSNIEFSPFLIAGVLPSWVNFLKFLNEKLKLTHIKFDGTLSNSLTEIWVTYDYDDDAGYHFGDTSPRTPYPPDCLKHRIERFVTGAPGQFPFYPMPQGVEPGIFPEECTEANNGWMWKPDRSWRIHEDLL